MPHKAGICQLALSPTNSGSESSWAVLTHTCGDQASSLHGTNSTAEGSLRRPNSPPLTRDGSGRLGSHEVGGVWDVAAARWAGRGGASGPRKAGRESLTIVWRARGSGEVQLARPASRPQGRAGPPSPHSPSADETRPPLTPTLRWTASSRQLRRPPALGSPKATEASTPKVRPRSPHGPHTGLSRAASTNQLLPHRVQLSSPLYSAKVHDSPHLKPRDNAAPICPSSPTHPTQSAASLATGVLAAAAAAALASHAGRGPAPSLLHESSLHDLCAHHDQSSCSSTPSGLDSAWSATPSPSRHYPSSPSCASAPSCDGSPTALTGHGSFTVPPRAYSSPIPLSQCRTASFCRRLANAASFATKVSSALDEEDLSVPWKESEKLTKLTSAMLRLGLQFEVADGELALPPPSPAASPLGPRSATLFPSSPAGIDRVWDAEAAANAHQRAARRHELQRLQELQDRIERRDRRRGCAKQHAEDQPRRETQALRAAMWLTLVKGHTHDVAGRLGRLLQSHLLTRWVLPMWRLCACRATRRRARQQLLAEVAPRTARLTPAQLGVMGPLFHDWPEDLLVAFAAETQLCPFAAGEYICHQGDPSALLYMLVAGTVDVVLRRPDCPGKARGKRTGLTTAQLTPGRYVGEYGVFAGEPRAATLYCATQVVAWAATKECLVRYLRQVPVPVFCGICTTFEASMAGIYKVRPAQLASSPLFLGWDLPTLEQVVARLQPVFFPENTVVLKAGCAGTAVFIVAKGRCCAVRGDTAEEHTAGALLGLRSCVFLEPELYEVRASTTVQAWRLPKAALMDFLLLRPDRFLEAKHRLNAELARTLVKPPVPELLEGSPLAALPRATQQQLCAGLEPVVVAARDAVVHDGDPVSHLIFLTVGHYTVPGPPPSASPIRCLGADQLGQRVPRWPHTVTAVERVEGWRLALADLAVVLEAQKGGPRHWAMKTLLADVRHLLGRHAAVGPPA